MAAKVTLQTISENISEMAALLVGLDRRVADLERPTARPSNGKGHKVTRRRKPNGKAVGKDNYVVIEPTETCRYRRYRAWYVVDGKDPFEKTFYGKKKMASFDWGLSKLYGQFRKYTDLPSAGGDAN